MSQNDRLTAFRNDNQPKISDFAFVAADALDAAWLATMGQQVPPAVMLALADLTEAVQHITPPSHPRRDALIGLCRTARMGRDAAGER